jgi:CDP-diacylglycerol--glycerol-3-phosphate 3-phosphatidyltransferase
LIRETKESKNYLAPFSEDRATTSSPLHVPMWLKKLPNRLTFLRILCIPFVVYLLIFCQDTPSFSFHINYLYKDFIIPSYLEIVAAIVFSLAAFTDFLDGWIARKFKIETVLGKLLDPLADKLLVVSTMIILVEKHRLFGWIAVLIIVRDLAANAIRLSALDEGIFIESSIFGKMKTLFQDLGIIGLIVYGPLLYIPFHLLGHIFIILSLICSIVSFIEYLRFYAKALKAKDQV